MDTQLYCPNETRKQLVRAAGTLNGIDFLEVLDEDAPEGSPRQRTLLLHCLRPVPGLSERNVTIAGGVRVRAVGVEWARPANAVPAGLLGASEVAYLALLPQPERILVVRTDRAGDFSPYTLRLVLSPTRTDSPPPGFDDLLAKVEFSFKVDCPSDFDRDPPRPALPPSPEVSRVDYLARDFSSFRRLMLDRMAASMPAWKERNPADLGIALVETLAYAADHLSYFQDAVATEAYLGTAQAPGLRAAPRPVGGLLHARRGQRPGLDRCGSHSRRRRRWGDAARPPLPSPTPFGHPDPLPGGGRGAGAHSRAGGAGDRPGGPGLRDPARPDPPLRA